MTPENPDTIPKKKADNSAFRKFEKLAEKIVRVPKAQVEQRPNKS